MATANARQNYADRSDERTSLRDRYRSVRAQTEHLCQPLETEDYVVQPVVEVSPPKWHLAHTTWFFEQFALARWSEDYVPFHPGYGFLFNSYYKTVGAHFDRRRRGTLTRPVVEDIYRYRRHVDERVDALLESAASDRDPALRAVIELGLHHEQQHQELLVTDIKYILGENPLHPVYRPRAGNMALLDAAPRPGRPVRHDAGLATIGANAESFAFDNERPAHRVFLHDFEIDPQPVTAGDYLEFIEAGGYAEPSLWLSDGWDRVTKDGWSAPLYWSREGGRWRIMTLHGLREIDPLEPVCHVSYYEADAYARWRGARLPTEAEWEVAAAASGAEPRVEDFLEGESFHPARVDHAEGPRFYGRVWEWTMSAYLPYPGFRPLPSSLGEYNGKFMSGQMVLRGGSCATPLSHIRPTYRNFFPPETRWQFSGIRLARGPFA